MNRHRCLLASCFLVVCALASSLPAQVVRSGTLGSEARAQLALLGPRADALVIDGLRGGDVAQRVRGPLGLSGATLEEQCDDLVASYGPLFGATPGVSFAAPAVLQRAPDGAPRHVRLAQLVHGAELEGHGLVLGFDAEGRAALVHGVLSAQAAALPAPAISAAQAQDVALAELAARGHVAAAFRSGPRTALIARVLPVGPELLWESAVVTGAELLPLVVDVSARNGALVRVRVARDTGIGTYHFNGLALPFQTGNGKGTTYTSLKNAMLSKPSSGKLPDVGLQTVVDGNAEDGFLYGRFAQMLEETGPGDFGVFIDPGHDFSVGTDDTTAGDGQLFDHVNTYAWITRSAHYLEGVFGPLGTDYSLPVFMNVFGLLNAAYSPVDFGLGHGPGFFVFGDASDQTGSAMDDFSRDPTVVTHEYVHGVADKAGLTFGDADNDTPSRAVNEAFADYFSTSFHKAPCLGPVFSAFLGPNLGLDDPCLRDLSEARLFPEDLFQVTGDGDLPEEHEAGVIFGASLWRVRTALKQKSADASIAGSSFDWPQSNAEVGFPVVTTGNAEAAYAAYYAGCLSALLDGLAAAGGAKLAGKALGPAMANGALGQAAFDTDWIADLSGAGKLAWQGTFLGGIDEHAVSLLLTEGQTVSVSVKGKSGATVDFLLAGNPGGLQHNEPKKVNAAGTSASEKNIAITATATYRLTVFNPVGFGGVYKATVTVKS